MKKEKACKKLKGALQAGRSSQFSCTSMEDSSFKIPVLPADLIIEILLRLPVISLLQFRCVSKSWLALISSPEFIKTHLMIATNNKDCTHLMLKVLAPKYKLMECSISSLLYESITKVVELDHPMKKQNKSICVVGAIDGLVCLILGGEDFVIWNPSIRKFKKFSDFGSGNHYMYGFGYDELHSDYKVLVISNEHEEIHLYSLSSDSWKSLGNLPSGGLFVNSEGIFVNGKLHWTKTTCENLNPFNLSKSKDINSYDSWIIISIDLANGKLENIEVPYYERGDLNITPCVAVMGSHLSVFCNNQNTSVTDVWIMKEYGIKESWTKMFTINRPCDELSGDRFCPFFCMSNEDEIMFEFEADILIYNPKDNSIRYNRVSNCKTFWDKSIYIESLVWPFPPKEPRMSNSCNHNPVFNNRK